MRCVRLPLILLFSILLLSWGQLGHRTIGVIAEKHLTAKARQGIQELLGNASLSDVANWADEVRRSPEYRTTGPWHYINLPLGLSRSEFDNMVTGMQDPNVYQAVRQMEQQLRDPARSQEERIDALKFLVHFVGDLHQPMHVSRAEDQGGNKIQVNFLGKGTNLHSLWDTGLPEQEGLNEEQLAARVDKATPAQIMVWQNEPLLQWLWESYQLSSSFYQEVDALSNRAITVDYYNRHQSILEERMEKAGIRLAGLLNAVFSGKDMTGHAIPSAPPSGPLPVKTPKTAVKTISIQEVNHHIGEEVKLCARVYGEKSFGNMTLVNLGAAYPNQLLTIVLKGEALNSWKGREGATICVRGKVMEYKGKPEIQVSSSEQITIQ